MSERTLTDDGRPAGIETPTAADRSLSADNIRDAYSEYAAWIHRLGWLDRLLVGGYRRRQFGRAEGRVLDVACGTGTNFRYLPDKANLVGIDISEDMLAYARRELDRLDRDGSLHRMNAQALQFDAESFDTVISALSTCTFPDPTAALQEMARVCAPDGRILLLEHGRSDSPLLARYQDWRADAHYERCGCRLTHDPLTTVCDAGLTVESTESVQLGRLTLITAVPG